ncbi:MAG: hypothetical protein WBV28_14120 [Terracidiphilus sp.]
MKACIDAVVAPIEKAAGPACAAARPDDDIAVDLTAGNGLV